MELAHRNETYHTAAAAVLSGFHFYRLDRDTHLRLAVEESQIYARCKEVPQQRRRDDTASRPSEEVGRKGLLHTYAVAPWVLVMVLRPDAADAARASSGCVQSALAEQNRGLRLPVVLLVGSVRVSHYSAVGIRIRRR